VETTLRDLSGTDWEYVPVDLKDAEHLRLIQAVGRVAVLSAELEQALRNLFYRLMVSDQALTISEGESPDWLLKNCKRLIEEEHMAEDARQGKRLSLLPLLQDCGSAFRERGTIIHSTWSVSPTEGAYIAWSSKRHRDMRFYEYSLDDIDALAGRFAELRWKVVAERDFGV
jgi:hypothetical protein